MRTYGFRVSPTDLCLKLRKAHEQNHIVFSPVAHPSRCRKVRCIGSVGDVGPDITQRLEHVFWVLSAFHEVREETKHFTWVYVLPPWLG